MDNLWEKALSLLQTEVNDQTLKAWFLPIRQVSCDKEGLVLGVPNKFFETWIREKYISLIKTSVQQIAGFPLSIKFKLVETNLSEETPLPESKKTAVQSGVVPPAGKEQKEQTTNWFRSVFGSTRQLPESQYRELGFNPNYTFENFVVGNNNRFAHAAALAICEKLAKVYNPFFIYGGVGLGKTHLMQAMAHSILSSSPKTKVLYISSEEFTNQLIQAIRTKTTQKFRSMYRNVDILLIDDIQFIAGKESTQEEFFHTFNALYDSHKQIVLSSDRSPQEIRDLEERLISRFAWGLVADIQRPDFETRMAIMEKKAEAASVALPKDVLFFLAEKIKTNIREMEGALIRVVAYAKLSGKEVSVPLAKEVLKGMISAEEKKITIDLIQKTVASFFNIALAEMKTKKRSRSVAFPRQLAMYLSRDLTDHSLPDIGDSFGGRDHTTVLHACDKISKVLDINESVRDSVKKIRELIRKE